MPDWRVSNSVPSPRSRRSSSASSNPSVVRTMASIRARASSFAGSDASKSTHVEGNGPRPIRPRFFEELAADLPAYWQRLVVRPGLTGFAQVRRGYETSMVEKLSHDLEWIADRSVRLYLRTLWATGWRVLRQLLHV